VVAVDALAEYPERIDVRTPTEFADDHLPDAGNFPVLDDDQRAEVGTLYARDAFAARKLGAAWVARNIARWLETAFADRGRDWQPLVYCWRGGKRSGAMVHILREVGWRAARLDGGYRAYRRRVVSDLEALPPRFGFVVVCGLTGTGKSRLLQALGEVHGAAAQVLDLEALACHRGSLLGELPAQPQPSQRTFESRVWTELSRLDPARPVFVEAESRKIGNLQVPDVLMQRMRASPCVRVTMETDRRAELLQQEYRHYLADPAALRQRLRLLAPVHGHARIAEWEAMIEAGDWPALVTALLELHYDPTYQRSMERNYRHYAGAPIIRPAAVDPGAFASAASELAERFASAPVPA
jgi:tRNA 2-selenouridine synthase